MILRSYASLLRDFPQRVYQYYTSRWGAPRLRHRLRRVYGAIHYYPGIATFLTFTVREMYTAPPDGPEPRVARARSRNRGRAFFFSFFLPFWYNSPTPRAYSPAEVATPASPANKLDCDIMR